MEMYIILSYIMRTEICSVAECRDTRQRTDLSGVKYGAITKIHHYLSLYSSPEANRFIGHNEDGSNDLLVALMDDVG